MEICCLRTFTFNTLQHSAFDKEFKCRNKIVKWNTNRPGKYSEGRCEIVKTTEDEECFWTSMEKEEMKQILTDMMYSDSSPWIYKITSVEDVPCPILDMLDLLQLNPNRIFPCCTDTNRLLSHCRPPYFLPKIVSPNRMIYHKRNKLSLDIDSLEKRKRLFSREEEEEQIATSDDDIGSESCRSISSVDVEFRSEKRADEKNEFDILLDSDSLLRVRKRNTTDPVYRNMVSEWHPYAVSCAAFSLSVYAEDEEKKRGEGPFWSARKIYFYIHDYLVDQTRLKDEKKIPDTVKRVADNMLLFFSEKDCEPQINRYLEQLLQFFSDCHYMLTMQHRSITKKKNQLSGGIMKKFTFVYPDRFKRFVDIDFHPHLTKGECHREPGALQCNCEKPSKECQAAVIRFDRKQVSPLELYTSMDIIERRYPVAVKDWNVIFTKGHTILVTESPLLYDITRNYLLDMLSHDRYVIRQLPLPVYYLHLHNYYYGNGFGLLSCMKFILKTFCFGRHYYSREKDMMISFKDPNIRDYYGILHLIAERFGTRERLIAHLTSPYRHKENYMWKRSGGRNTHGIREDVTTIYSSLRAFVLIKARHFILKHHLSTMIKLFKSNPSMQSTHKQLRDQLMKLEEDICDDDGNYVEIVQNKDHPFPTHMLFYYFCAHKDVEDSVAVETFLSIGTAIFIKKKTMTASGCSFIRFPSMTQNHQHVKEDSRRARSDAECADCSKSAAIRDLKEPHAGMCALLQCLEELSLIPIEERSSYSRVKDYIPLRSPVILADQKHPPLVPSDVSKDTKEPLYVHSSLPIWKSNIYENSHREGETLRECVFLGDREARPFFGCHIDLLGCIVAQPIVQIDCLPKEEPLGMDMCDAYPDSRNLYDPSPSYLPPSPAIDKKVQHLRDRVIEATESIKNHGSAPSYEKIWSMIK